MHRYGINYSYKYNIKCNVIHRYKINHKYKCNIRYMYAITQHDASLWQITLPKPKIFHLPGARPNNVYVIQGDAPALINTGHPSQLLTLYDALRSCNVDPSSIERIVATSWSIDHLGNAHHFKDADVFALAGGDGRVLTDYEAWVARYRARFMQLFDALRTHTDVVCSEDESLFLDYVTHCYPHLPYTLSCIPLSHGQSVCLGADVRLEVHVASGPDEGHTGLFERTRKWLFSGEVICDGLPQGLMSAHEYVEGVSSWLELEPEVLFPNYGLADTRATKNLKRHLRFVSNFITNVSHVLSKGPNVFEFTWRDLGIKPTDKVRYAWTVGSYQTLLNELAQSGKIASAGAGFLRRYGVGPNEV